IFNTNTVTSAKWIDGGGIIGASGSAKGNGKEPHGGIGLIDHTSFIGNTIKANDGQIMGGLIYSYGAAGGMTIKDSLFGLNEFYSKITTPIADYNAKVYGAITIDTGATLYTGDKEHVVTLISTALEQDAATGFYKNAIYEDNNTTTPNRYNSFYFGTMPYVDGGDLQQDYAAADARLVIASGANGYVFLLDPIAVSQKNEDKNFTFNMDIGRKDGLPSGLLIWGGKNKFELLTKDGNADANNSGKITMYAGSTTSLVNMNSFTTLVNYGELWSKVFQSADSMTLEAPNYYVDLQKDAWLNIEGLNYWDLSTTVNSNSTKVKFYGDLHFNLNNTQDYDDTTIPKDYSDTLSKEYPLLTIKTPDEAGVIDLTGATVHLQDFLGDKELHAGDRFYLIEATDSDAINQKKFTGENQLSNDKDEDGNFIAYARQGLTRGYYFIIDLNGEHDDGDLINTRYLTARLRSAIPIPAKELIPPAESRITGVSFLNHLALPNLYNIDPQCAPEESCTPCNPCDPSYTKHTNWIRTPFISITGDWYSADTGNSSNFHIRGSVFQVGLAFQKKIHNGRLFWGAFFDNSSADYDTYNYIDEIKRNPDFHGNGELTATGGGIFIKRQWKNWQLDGLFRAGTLHNKYFNEDIHIHNTNFEMKYNTNSMYLATELGLSRQWKINKRQSLNLYSRYAWNYLDNNTITWNYETIDGDHLKFSEKVRFDHINSHRAKLGFHYLDKRTSRLSWFLDGGYEYEFDGQANGYAYGVGSFDGPRLKGGYGIGEIGFNYNKNNKFKLVSSFGGYVGNRKGININFAATWKW
ncbi:MAG: autotransporter outer membrane beta-barrel domain-containing protein, partial [Planctomycetaceae bacterium]|nr:autotransporter outer membrane beta-barrel domain-containing protein [Planctomycetaceae bacterium]